MRKLILLILVSAMLYGGYWFVGRSQIQNRLSEALEEVDAGPMDVRYATLNTRGFPSRFDTTFTELVIDNPDAGVRWETPLFQLLALSYQPNNVRAYFPEEQVFVVDGERFTLITEEMVARGQVSPSANLAFQQAELELINPRLRTEDGAELALARFFAAMRMTPNTPQTYDVFFEARSIALPEDIRRILDPGNLQPPVMQSLRFDSDIELSTPIALNSPDAEAPLIDVLSIRELAFEWGEISLSAIGDLTPDIDGDINGTVTISARNWQQALDLAVASGAVSQDRRQFFIGIINTLDETPHIADTLTATLTIVNGDMALGPLPLGPAPRLR